MKEAFEVHTLNDLGLARAREIGEAFSTLLEKAESLVPGGREIAIVRTKLEEACFFAKRGIASQAENQASAPPPAPPATPATPDTPPAS